MSRIETSFEFSAEHAGDSAWADCETSGEIMVGLTPAETREFMALDARNQIDENGNPFQWPWDITGAAKARWLALFEKHEAALERVQRLDRAQRRPK
jgi:hypothetical protein